MAHATRGAGALLLAIFFFREVILNGFDVGVEARRKKGDSQAEA